MRKLPFLLLALGLCFGCKGDPGPIGPQGTLLTGSLTGYVVLRDESGQRLTDHSGVTVSVQPTLLSTTTDVSGHWTLSNLSTGVYTIILSKPGFGTYKIVSFQFVGGGEVYASSQFLIQLPSFSVPAISVNASSTDKLINVTGNISSGKAPQRNVILLYGRSALVTSNPPNYDFVDYTQTVGDSTAFTASLYSPNLYQYGIASGTTVYIRAYASSNIWYGYTDPSTGKTVYCSLDTTGSNVVGVVVP